MPVLQRRAGALSGVTQSASDGVQAGYNSLKALSLSKGQIAGVVVGIVLVLGLTILALWYLCIRQTRKRKLRRNTTGLGPSMRMRETNAASEAAQQRSRACKPDSASYDFGKNGRGSGRASGYGDYSQVQGPRGARAGDRAQRVYEEQGDEASLLSESTLMDDGPAVPLVAAAGANTDRYDWARGHRQSVRFSRQQHPSQGRT